MLIVKISGRKEYRQILSKKKKVDIFSSSQPLLLLFSLYVVSDSSATPWTVVLQDPLSMGFLRPEYWRGLLFLSPGSLPHPGLVPMSPASQMDSLPLSHPGTTPKLSFDC